MDEYIKVGDHYAKRSITNGFTEAEIIEAFEFLDALRRTGALLNFQAIPLLAMEMSLPQAEAKALWDAWAGTFNGLMSARARVRAIFHAEGL